MPAVPRFLVALDVGRTTGLAYGALSAVKPLCDSWALDRPDAKHNPVGARCAVLDHRLAEFFDAVNPSHLVMAERIPSRNAGEAASSFGLDGIVLAECYRRGIRVLVQPEGTVRKEVLGRGTAPTDVMKALVLDWCDRQGIAVTDHNAGDAAVLWRWARDEIVRQVRARLRLAA